MNKKKATNINISKLYFNFKLFFKSQYHLLPSFMEKPICKSWEKKVIMLHGGRCGSTVLGDILAQNSMIHWGGEIYTELLYTHLEKRVYELNDLKKSLIMCFFVDRLLKSKEKNIYGFEIDMLDFSEPYLEYLYKTTEVNYFILLKRKNCLRQIISHEIAKIKSIYHLKNEKHQSLTKLKLDVNKGHPLMRNTEQSLLDRIKYYDSHLSKCEQFLSNRSIPFLTLNYEDNIQSNPYIAGQLVCDFLGVEFFKSKINYVKTNPYKIQDILSNYDEVRDYLKGTKFEWMVYT